MKVIENRMKLESWRALVNIPLTLPALEHNRHNCFPLGTFSSATAALVIMAPS
jgi:hypothetical protein